MTDKAREACRLLVKWHKAIFVTGRSLVLDDGRAVDHIDLNEASRLAEDAIKSADISPSGEPTEGMREADASMLICAVDAAIAAIDASSASAPILACLKAARTQFLGARAALRASVAGWQNDQHELLVFLAIHADRYQRDYGLNGLHPTHYDLMKKYGARMDDFLRATNAPVIAEEYGEKK